MCRFYCIAIMKYMLAGKTLSVYTRHGKITYKYFKDKYGRRSKSRV